MKKLLYLIPLIFLTACSESTIDGGSSLSDTPVTNHYTIPQAVEDKVNNNAEVIILTEFYVVGAKYYDNASQEIHSFIQTASDQMLTKGYILMSSDTNSMGSYGDKISITLIFHKK